MLDKKFVDKQLDVLQSVADQNQLMRLILDLDNNGYSNDEIVEKVIEFVNERNNNGR